MRRGLPASIERRLDPVERYGLRLTLLGVSLVLVAVPFGLLLEQVTSEGRLTRLDSKLARQLNAWSGDHPSVVGPIQAVSFLGRGVWLWVLVGAAVLWLLRRQHHRLAVFLLVTCLGGGLVSTLVKVTVGRSRPVVADPVATAPGKSFPSGHAMAAVVCYGALLLVFLPTVPPRLRRLLVAATALLVALIGATRLALGVHFLTDVLAGFVLGLAWLLASVAAFAMWREERGHRRQPLAEGVEPEELPRRR